MIILVYKTSFRPLDIARTAAEHHYVIEGWMASHQSWLLKADRRKKMRLSEATESFVAKCDRMMTDRQEKLLDGAVILVVDDELLIGLDTEWLLQRAGAVVSGPFTTLSSALASLEQNLPTLAIVDFELLTERGVPTPLYSGQLSLDELPPNCTYLPKPATHHALIRSIATLLGKRG